MIRILKYRLALIILSAGIFVVPWIIINQGRDKPPAINPQIAIVFGAAAYSDIFKDRLLTAAELYFDGHVKKILVSGDHSKIDYNEPQFGKDYLMLQGVNAEDIILDYAGLRTLDTCARAQAIFGIESAYLVTQYFHLPRAQFLCEHFGISTLRANAARRQYRDDTKNQFRETLAQQQAFWEVTLGLDAPKYLGEKIDIWLPQ